MRPPFDHSPKTQFGGKSKRLSATPASLSPRVLPGRVHPQRRPTTHPSPRSNRHHRCPWTLPSLNLTGVHPRHRCRSTTNGATSPVLWSHLYNSPTMTTGVLHSLNKCLIRENISLPVNDSAQAAPETPTTAQRSHLLHPPHPHSPGLKT